MKLIIDIPEDEVNECKMQVEMIKQEGVLIENLSTALKIHVANGTPLPKDNRWIPYSERFPDETGVYIVTVRDKKIPEITGTKIDRWCLDDDKYRWIKYENLYGDNEYEIVAWMPLPKPYKEAKE